MPASFKPHLQAVFCGLLPGLCYLLVRPYAEIGVGDDWSYIWIAQRLARTGHINYDGWASPIIGWQLFLGAGFVKIFGFSFTIVRCSILLVAMATAFLLHRTFVRAGLSDSNATFAVAALVLSQTYLQLSFTFATDVPGIFSIVLCLYLCLRALEVDSTRSAMAWVSFAALSNAILGSVRQTAWFGVLVIVPCTLWILRRKRPVLLVGGLSCVAGAGVVFAVMRWFSEQPYSEQLVPGAFDHNAVRNVGILATRGGGELCVLLLPVLLLFAGTLRRFTRRRAVAFGAGCLGIAVLGLVLSHHSGLQHYIASVTRSTVPDDLFEGSSGQTVRGVHPVPLRSLFCFVLGIATVSALLSLLTFHLGNLRGTQPPPDKIAYISWKNLAILLGPFTFIYLVSLVPRATQGLFSDRYLLPLTALASLAITRYYQDQVRTRLPVASLTVLALFTALSITSLHDYFARYRGYLAAIDELRRAGIPATAIQGPFEYDGWTEVETVGYVNNSTVLNPRGAYVPQPPRSLPGSCDTFFLDMTPVIRPLYGLSSDPDACDGPSRFPPVTYRTWLGQHESFIYIVRYPI